MILLFIINIYVYFSAYANPYYLDLEVTINKDGTTILNGKTDNNYIKELINEKITQNLTMKNKEYWLFNLTSKETYSNYIIEINYPKNSEINYIKSKGNFRLSNEKIIFLGKNNSIEILIQYKIINKNSLYLKTTSILIIILILITLISFFYYKKTKINIIKNEAENRKEEYKYPYERVYTYLNTGKSKEYKKLFYTLTDTQKKIYEILKKEKKGITQKEIQKKLNLPKSSLSRNIESLRLKGIIIKEKKGMSNIIFLNDEFR
ncbi:MAG: winged helix-turn-helix transcriptional regulator [Candidatus Woesearchaeota archaeon]